MERQKKVVAAAVLANVQEVAFQVLTTRGGNEFSVKSADEVSQDIAAAINNQTVRQLGSNV